MHRARLWALLWSAALGSASPAGRAVAAAQGEERPGAGQEAAARQEEALRALHETSDALASAKTLKFKVRSLVPMKTPGGRWITLVGTASVVRDGHDKLLVQVGGDLFPFQLFLDGKTATAFAPDEKLYAQKDAKGTIDEVLAKAARAGEATFVFADLVSADPYAAMTKGLRSAVVVGTSSIDGQATRHLAVDAEQVHWEIWIGMEDQLPRMVTLTDTRDPGRPTHIVMLSDWERDAPVQAEVFAFVPPQDAMRVPFRAPGAQRVAGRRSPTPVSP